MERNAPLASARIRPFESTQEEQGGEMQPRGFYAGADVGGDVQHSRLGREVDRSPFQAHGPSCRWHRSLTDRVVLKKSERPPLFPRALGGGPARLYEKPSSVEKDATGKREMQLWQAIQNCFASALHRTMEESSRCFVPLEVSVRVLNCPGLTMPPESGGTRESSAQVEIGFRLRSIPRQVLEVPYASLQSHSCARDQNSPSQFETR